MNLQQGELASAVAEPTGRPIEIKKAGWTPAGVFTSDHPAEPDHLGRGAHAAFLAEVIAHRGVETPFCIGLFGGAGAGKSTFLSNLLTQAERLGHAAEEAGLATPFHGNIAVARVEASAGSTPGVDLMRQVATALASTHPRLVTEASHAGLDPRIVVREAAERANEARQRLEAERASLAVLVARQAKLTDTILFESAGSNVDNYARGSRGRIERAVRGFGIAGDPLTVYKDAVREASEAGGPVARWTSWLRAFWAYRGQSRLLVLAAALLLAAWGLGSLIENEPRLLESVRSGGERMAGFADWLESQWHWLQPLKRVLQLAALVAVAINLFRGVRFLMPIHRGVTFLRNDIEARRRDLDNLVAHQTRRVDTLVREAELAAELSTEAERRLAAAAAGSVVPPVREASDPAGVPRSFFTAVAATMDRDRLASSGAPAPARLVIGIDGLDDLTSVEAAGFLQAAHRLLHAPGFVTVVAADRNHLATGLAETDPALAALRLDRLVQIPYDFGGEAWKGSAAFARALLEGDDGNSGTLDQAPLEAAVSLLDRPWTQSERAMVEALAPVAGATPRGVKRFVNLYRVARADPRLSGGTAKDFAALAMGLALQSAGLSLDALSYGAADDGLERARNIVAARLGAPLGRDEGALGFETARVYGAGR